MNCCPVECQHPSLCSKLSSFSLTAGGDLLPAVLYASRCPITCAKADTAAAEEAAAILAAAGGAGAMPLRGIMHAGAVLDSKVIANISAASIRAEFAGACCARGCL